MKVFVTGATGFVGSAVSKALLAAGHDVSGLCTSDEKAVLLREAGMMPVVGDMRDASIVGPAAAAADTTVICTYLRTKGRFTSSKLRDVDTALRKHVEIIVEAASSQKGRVIMSSGYLIFAEGPDGWADEACPLKPPKFSLGFVDTGNWLLEQHKKGVVNGAVLCPGFVYGPSGSFLEMAQMIKKGSMPLAGGGKFYWSPVYIEDLAQGYVAAVEGKADGRIVLLVNDEPMLMRDMMIALADEMGVKRPGSVPKFMAKIFMGAAMVEGFSSSRRCRNTLAKELLGWKPKYATYKEGLPHVVKEMKVKELV